MRKDDEASTSREPSGAGSGRSGASRPRHRFLLLLVAAGVAFLGSIAGDFLHRAKLRGQARPDPAHWELRIGDYARTMIDAYALSFEPGLYGGRLGLTLHAEAIPLTLPSELEAPVEISFRADFGLAGRVTVRVAEPEGIERFITLDPRDPGQSGLFVGGGAVGLADGCTTRSVENAEAPPGTERSLRIEVDEHRLSARVDDAPWLDCDFGSGTLAPPILQAGASELFLDEVRIRAGPDSGASLAESFDHPWNAPGRAPMARMAGAFALLALWILESVLLRGGPSGKGPRLALPMGAALAPLAMLSIDPPHLVEAIRLESNIVKNTADQLWVALALFGVLAGQVVVFFRFSHRYRSRPSAPAAPALFAAMLVLVGSAAGLAALTHQRGIDPIFQPVRGEVPWAVGIALAYVVLRLASAVAFGRLAHVPTARALTGLAWTDLPFALTLGVVLWLDRDVQWQLGEAWTSNAWGWVCVAGMVSATLRLLGLHANGGRMRAFLPLMLGATLCIGAYAEGALRTTYLNSYWFPHFFGGYQQDDIFGWTRRELGRIGEGSFVGGPEKASPEEQGLGGRRIISLGGSTTDMGENAYTVFLQESLDRDLGEGAYSVVNLGVGGWATYRIARYVENYVHQLEPSILVLYVSYNEASFTGVPFTMKQIAERVSGRSTATVALLRFLERSRLFVGYKKVILAAAGQTFEDRDRVAVPPEDTRENLARIIQVADGVGAKVLLVSEAVSAADDRPRLAPYGVVMAKVAAQHDNVAYRSGQQWFDEAHRSDLFEDLVHPTVPGAQLLASHIHASLEELGWIEAAP